MSDRSSLTELTRFVGKSALSKEDAEFRQHLNRMTRALDPRYQRRSVSELLGIVLTVSARTRRMMLPRVHIDMDVFAPGGRRAARVVMVQQSQ